MKKFLIIVFLISGYNFLHAINPHNTIECPPGLDLFDSSIKNRYDLLLQKYKSQNEYNISHIILYTYAFLNGFPFPIEGFLNFQPSVSSSVIAAYMKNTMYFQPPHTSFSEGVLNCTYKYGVDKKNNDASLLVTISSKNSGVLYQCPFPEDIMVEEQRETQLVKVVSVPSCKGKFKGSCSNYIKTFYVDRDRIIPEKEGSGFYHLEGPLLGLIADPTASKKMPMRYEKIMYKGSDKVYTYKFVGKYGSSSLASQSVDKDVEKGGLVNLTAPENVNFINRGFGQDLQHRAITEKGDLVMPPCKATQIIKNNEGLKVRCVYGSDNDPDRTIFLDSIKNLESNINIKKCSIWSDRYKGELMKKVLAADGTAILWSIQKDGTHTPPAVIFCPNGLNFLG